MNPTALVTGASGFIALHVVDELLKKNFNVIGTVRSQEKGEALVKNFKKEYPNAQISFVIVKDIAEKDAFKEVFQKHPEITFVLHTASPFSFGLNKSFEDGYLVPACEGTKNILLAIKDYAPQVKHLIVTSSFAAIINSDKVGDKSFVHTEQTWNPIEWKDVNNELTAYVASKKLAEKLARDFVKNEKPSFKLTTVNPPYVLGPQKFCSSFEKSILNTSSEIINNLLKTKPDCTDLLEDPSGLAVDVRDVAKLHVLPLLDSNLEGMRLFPANGAFNSQTLLNMIHRLFDLDQKVGRGKPENAEKVMEEKACNYDTSETQKATKMSWIPLETTIRDSVSQILDNKV